MFTEIKLYMLLGYPCEDPLCFRIAESHITELLMNPKILPF